MDTRRKSLIAAGALYFIATGAYLTGSGLIDGSLSLPGLPDAAAQLRVGVLFELVNVVAVAAIGLLLLPVLRPVGERLALGYAATRLFEATVLTISAGAPLALLVLGTDRQTGLAWHDATFQLAMIGLGAGSLLLCVALHRGRMLPAAFPILGYVSYVALLLSGVLTVLGAPDTSLLYAPGAVFEFVFPLWLIVKGLRLPATPTPAVS